MARATLIEQEFAAADDARQMPGGFQIRPRTLGIDQGSAIELAFWHPSSGMPEHGLCR